MDTFFVWEAGSVLGFFLLLIYFRFHQKVEKIPFIWSIFFSLIWPITVIVILSVWSVNGLSKVYSFHVSKKNVKDVNQSDDNFNSKEDKNEHLK